MHGQKNIKPQMWLRQTVDAGDVTEYRTIRPLVSFFFLSLLGSAGFKPQNIDNSDWRYS